jgi:glutamate-1-semialdehyde 2,1-aminomutase
VKINFLNLSPGFIVRGEGANVWDLDGNKFIDWGMGLTSVVLGHAYEPVIMEVTKRAMTMDQILYYPSHIEAEVSRNN